MTRKDEAICWLSIGAAFIGIILNVNSISVNWKKLKRKN